MSARPLVTVQASEGSSQVPLPHVFLAPIRTDVVQQVHANMAKNRRQAYAVSPLAGHQHSAESWGTGRAVSRIPRVSGSGTHRAGQGAFGNMCRKGRMFAPTKVWRRWHRKIAVNQRRFAVASALAATAVPALVQARGHRIGRIAEVPLVWSDSLVEGLTKTKNAVALLKKYNAYRDVERVAASRHVRRGKGKMRNRRHVQRRGPLIVMGASQDSLIKAVRNIPGIDVAIVDRLNLLALAPGGHLGRFVIWTESAFKRLDTLFGTGKVGSANKSGFVIPRAKVTNADIGRIINSDEVQSVVRATRRQRKYHALKKNPLNNLGVMVKLNPYVVAARRRQLKSEAAVRTEEGRSKRKADRNAKKPQRKRIRAGRKDFYSSLLQE